jgi:alkanesulfonate monooxygenase SsuD/methylene tetrahydromethanopterin reductase-like flavin-dependent oxidoreductase (luciferase family)
MKYGYVIPGGTPSEIVDLAVAAEDAGWDGVFCWEGVYHYNPWTTLSAIAMRTSKIRLGTMLTPAPRRRPWQLAGECVTLDELSGGRVILSVGVGAFDTALGELPGEEHDMRIRGEILDETIDLLRAMWSGEPVDFNGTHHAVKLPAGPKPVQPGGIPIWCVGVWPRMKSMRRTLRCDGVVVQSAEDVPSTYAAVAEYVRENGREGLDVIAQGTTKAASANKEIQPFADAGATWWLEANWAAGAAAVRKRIDAGPLG